MKSFDGGDREPHGTSTTSELPHVQASGVLTGAVARVARSLLEGGAVTASDLAERLYLTPTAVRRHLDALVDRGYVTTTTQAPFGPQRHRGRGRPAKYYSLTPLGRDAFESSYEDVAVGALRFIESEMGAQAVLAFARQRAQEVEARYARALDGIAEPDARAEALALALRRDGFAASATEGTLGTQLCQNHCPLMHVAEEFGEFCEAEREAFSRLLGVHVTRLSTIASGGGVCTTHIPTTAEPARPGVAAQRSTA